MRYIAVVLLVVTGVVMMALGLLFLIGAGGVASRYVIAAVGLLLGAVSAGFGLRILRGLKASSPQQIRADILAEARRRKGELSAADLGAVLGARLPAAAPVLEQMVRAGICRQETREGASFYLFEGLLARMVVKRCGYCSYEAPISEQTGECPKCGGPLSSVVAQKSLSGGDELYSLDE